MKAWTFADGPRLGVIKRLQAGVLLVVFTMVIVLLSPVFGLSQAKAAVNDQIAIKNVSLVKVKGQDGEEELPGQGMQLWEYANLKFDWDATGVNPNLSSGDQFTISLPQELEYVASDKLIDIKLSGDDTVYGSCERTTSKITCTFNDAVNQKVQEGFRDFKGKGKIVVRAMRTTTQNTTNITVTGPEIQPVPLPGGKPITKSNPVYNKFPPTEKEVWSITGTSNKIQWIIRFGTESLKAAHDAAGAPINFDGQTVHTLTFIDKIGPGHKYDLDPSRWYLDRLHKKTEANQYPEDQRWLASLAKPSGGFSINVEYGEETPEGTTATITVSGPFDVDTNYRIFYNTIPSTANNRPKEGFVYTNSARYEHPTVVAESKSSVKYVDTASVTIEMKPGYGSFAVTKMVSGPSGDKLADGTTFPVTVSWKLPDGKTVDNYNDWNAPAGVNAQKTGGQLVFNVVLGKKTQYNGSFPIGTIIILNEDLNNVAAPAGTHWGTPVFTIGNTATNILTVQDRKSTNVSIENKLERNPMGSFSVKKVVAGAYTPTDTDNYTVNYTCGTEKGTLTVKANGDAVVSKEFPVGTVCTIAEEKQGTMRPGFNHAVTYTVDGTAGAQVTIAQGKTPEVVVTNTYTAMPKVSVGDRVWFDENKNGLQDDGEPGIDNVELTITRSDGLPVMAFDNKPYNVTTTTANGGMYSFDNLQALTDDVKYIVTVTPPAGYQATKANAGDPDRDSSTGFAESSQLTENGDNDPTLDFGFIKPKVSVGDFVWVDKNDNGLQDDGDDAGIEGVKLQITGPAGFAPRETTTGADGKYLFSDLPVLEAGQKYTVTIMDTPENRAKLAAYSSAKEHQGTDRKLDSSTNNADTIETLATDGDKDLSLDFGFVKKPAVSVGDYVWHDVNRDGLQDATDVPLQDVVLTISRTDGKPVMKYDGTEYTTTTKTNKDGKYLFENLQVLPDGVMYKVEVTSGVPADLVPTAAGVGDDRGKDSSTASATAVALPKDGDSDLTLDFGYASPRVSVGDRVWFDENKNGLQDDGESGIADVTLTISRTDGKPVMKFDGTEYTTTTKTDKDGMYGFADLQVLPDGVMYVVTVTDPAGYQATVAEAGDDRAKDSSTGKATAVALPKDGDKDLSLDFGYIKPAVSVGDYVWHDVNRDGLQDATDVPLQDVVLTISRTDGKPVMKYDGTEYTTTTKTNKDGKYLFENLQVLPDGVMYKVEVTSGVPADLVPTAAGVGDDRGKDSSTASATAVALPKDGDSDLTLDFGYASPRVSVGDRVWFDENKNGLQDDGESGIADVTLTISRTDGKPVMKFDGTEYTTTTKTDKDGMYGFADLQVLPDGVMYVVTVTDPAGYQATVAEAGDDRAKDSSTGKATAVALPKDGDKDLSLDFGFVKKVITPPNLPKTGANVAVFSALALALFGLGVALVQRRKTN